VTVSIALGLVLLGGGAAYAGYRYDAASANRIMPGVTIAGVDVGELTRAEAIAAVEGVVASNLDRKVTVRAGGQAWHVTPAELGTRAPVDRLVSRAMAVSEEHSWPSRVFHRVFDRPVDQSFDVDFRYRPRRVTRFVDTIAAEVAVDPTNASVDYENGRLVLNRPEFGRALRLENARAAVLEALRGSGGKVKLGMKRIEPEITRDELGQTLVVDLSELRLSLYEGLRLRKTYPVAAGQPQYPTPPGEWTVIDKVENPTWVNPAPDGWGAGLPASIPGGPSNPLGTRAIYLDAPGIRIHGTSSSSSIGTYASHGCVRMYMSDVEELYELVDVGATVHIVS
jgi:L,D-transpeptidase catalytic domain/Putative peptidoglycan binding domain